MELRQNNNLDSFKPSCSARRLCELPEQYLHVHCDVFLPLECACLIVKNCICREETEICVCVCFFCAGNIPQYCVVAEFVGMMMYAFIGGGAGVNAASSGLATTALGNGLCLAVLIYSTAGVSGGHRTCPCYLTTWVEVSYRICAYDNFVTKVLLSIFKIIGCTPPLLF
jgi:hypothetical protein